MRTESSAAKAFATIRFEGDALDTAALDDLIRARPTLAYRKGASYRIGRRGIETVGATGYWFLNTKGLLETTDLDAHVGFSTALLTACPPDTHQDTHAGPTFDRLKTLVAKDALRVLVTLFWFGREGARIPTVEAKFRSLLDDLPGEIETDFSVSGADTAGIEGHAA